MLHKSISADPRTGTDRFALARSGPSYFDRLCLDADESLAVVLPVMRVRRKRPFTKRQRERMTAKYSFIVEQDRAAIAYEKQCEAEDRATAAYLESAAEKLRQAAEKKQVLDDVFVAEFEKVVFRHLRNGRGFRPRPSPW